MRHIRRLIKHTGWISLALVTLFGVRAFVDPRWLHSANEVGGSFLQTFGGMYGVIVAFAMYVVWQQHNETQTAIEREAVTLIEVWTLLGKFSFAGKEHLRTRLYEYATVVPRLNRVSPEHCTHDEQSLLSMALDEYLAVTPTPGIEERLFDATLDLFHELNEAREHRLTVSRFRLAEGMRWFVIIGGVISVGALCLLYVEALLLHAIFVAGMTWVVVGAASIIFDLDDPYTGDFIVNWTRFEAAARTMQPAAAC